MFDLCFIVTHMSTDNIRKSFGNNLEEVIKNIGMTKKAVSEKSGIPYSSLNAIIKGYRCVTLEAILSLAEAMNIKASSLIPSSLLADSKEKSQPC